MLGDRGRPRARAAGSARAPGCARSTRMRSGRSGWPGGVWCRERHGWLRYRGSHDRLPAVQRSRPRFSQPGHARVHRGNGARPGLRRSWQLRADRRAKLARFASTADAETSANAVQSHGGDDTARFHADFALSAARRRSRWPCWCRLPLRDRAGSRRSARAMRSGWRWCPSAEIDLPVRALPDRRSDGRKARNDRRGYQGRVPLPRPARTARRFATAWRSGDEAYGWTGTATVARKAEWPDWTPPAEMVKRWPHVIR